MQPTIFLLTNNNGKNGISDFFTQWWNWYFWFLNTQELNYNNNKCGCQVVIWSWTRSKGCWQQLFTCMTKELTNMYLSFKCLLIFFLFSISRFALSCGYIFKLSFQEEKFFIKLILRLFLLSSSIKYYVLTNQCTAVFQFHLVCFLLLKDDLWPQPINPSLTFLLSFLKVLISESDICCWICTHLPSPLYNTN